MNVSTPSTAAQIRSCSPFAEACGTESAPLSVRRGFGTGALAAEVAAWLGAAEVAAGPGATEVAAWLGTEEVTAGPGATEVTA